MFRDAAFFFWLFSCFSFTIFGQQVIPPNGTQAIVDANLAGGHVSSAAAPPEARYYRLICLVHLTGSGKHDDPVRPEFVPTDAVGGRDGILAWSVQMSDDRKMAIVHLVAANRRAFDAILSDKRQEMKVFEVGKHGKKTIEDELKKYKKDFDLDSFQVVAQ